MTDIIYAEGVECPDCYGEGHTETLTWHSPVSREPTETPHLCLTCDGTGRMTDEDYKEWCSDSDLVYDGPLCVL